MNAQLISLAVGTKTNSYTGVWSGGFYTGSPAITNRYWLNGVTNAYADSQGQLTASSNIQSGVNYIAPINSWYGVCVGHGTPETNTQCVWFNQDGTYYTNRVIGRWYDGNIDFGLVLMEKTNQTWFKSLPNLINKMPGAYGVAGFPSGLNGCFLRQASIGSGWWKGLALLWGLSTNGSAGYAASTCISDTNFANGGVGGGDSGTAAFTVINNEEVYIGNIGHVGGGDFIGSMTNYINQHITNLANTFGKPAGAVELYDLSGFADQYY